MGTLPKKRKKFINSWKTKNDQWWLGADIDWEFWISKSIQANKGFSTAWMMNQAHVVLKMHLRIPEVFICIWRLQCLFALLLLLLAVRALYQVEWNWIIAADNSRRLPGNYLSSSQLHDWLPLVSLVWDPWGGLYNVHAKATIWCVWFYHRCLWGYPDCIPERRKKFSSQSNDGEEVTPMSDLILYTKLLWRFDSLSSSRPPPCF